MGSPIREQRYAAMHDWAGTLIQKHIKQNYDTSIDILDVGAGWGKYHHLLPEYVMDACEIWLPYIESEGLDDLYRLVYNGDICTMPFTYYDVIIMGDVFEHIERERAKTLLDNIFDRCDQLYIAVPYLYHQDEVDGNPFEKHLQADLTIKLMDEEYPMLKLLDYNTEKGIYIKR